MARACLAVLDFSPVNGELAILVDRGQRVTDCRDRRGCRLGRESHIGTSPRRRSPRPVGEPVQPL